MTPSATYDTRAIADDFSLPGIFVSAQPYGNGHINDTFALTYLRGQTRQRYILQRINHRVFKDPDALMGNIERVCTHAHAKLKGAGVPEAHRRSLALIPTRTGRNWLTDAEGNRWRVYHFIEGATGHDVVRHRDQAYQAAQAFGAFQHLLTDLPGPRLAETIPNFHHTPTRYAHFLAALARDTHGRAARAQPEIAFAQARATTVTILTTAMARGEIPERVTHNDTKLNNVLLDDVTQAGLCVIDLDTVMPGCALYDFGDLVRTSTSPAAEDERDVSKVTLQLTMFEALVQGYLSTAGSFLTPLERKLLPSAGQLITFEIGLRFLTDWLEGDVYFKVKRPEHNLDRVRTQFALVASIEAQFPAMQAIVARQ